jgi:hypothetical protein
LIVSQISQSNLGIDTRASKGEVRNLDALATVVPTFVCPSMSVSDMRVFSTLTPTTQSDFAFSNYRCVSGTNLNAASPFGGLATNAAMYQDSVIALRDVREGESSTAMLSESTFEIWGDGNSTGTRTAKHNSDGVCNWGIDRLAPSSGSATFNSFRTMPGSQLAMSAGSWHGKLCSR